MQCQPVCNEVRPSVRNEVIFLKIQNDKILLKLWFRTQDLSRNGMYGRTDVRNEVILPLAKMEISM
jgi:hypothetical protein